jgi:hypothetical protein
MHSRLTAGGSGSDQRIPSGRQSGRGLSRPRLGIRRGPAQSWRIRCGLCDRRIVRSPAPSVQAGDRQCLPVTDFGVPWNVLIRATSSEPAASPRSRGKSSSVGRPNPGRAVRGSRSRFEPTARRSRGPQSIQHNLAATSGIGDDRRRQPCGAPDNRRIWSFTQGHKTKLSAAQIPC